MEPSRLLFAGALGAALAMASPAWAQKGTVHVVSIESDDAEDQADAFTGALKSRMRQAPGWTPSEASSSLGPLLMALKCPPKPDAACLTRIGDHLKTDKYFWGTMQRAGKGAVSVELHLWSRGKPDQSLKETYSDNLKDQNDDALRKIAGRLFERLAGVGAPAGPGAIAVHITANTEDGSVIVDGKEAVKLENGAGTVEVQRGHHEIEVRTADNRVGKRSLDVTAETNLQIEVVAEGPPPPPTPSKPFPLRKVIGFSVAGLGLVSGVIGIVEGVQFLNLQSKNDADHKEPNYTGVKDFCSADGMSRAGMRPCQTIHDAELARALEITFFGVGAALIATGFVIVITDPGPKTEQAPQATWRIVPSVGPRGGALGLVGTF
jgi:hypothetical protein